MAWIVLAVALLLACDAALIALVRRRFGPVT